jgi:hypothetical protein
VDVDAIILNPTSSSILKWLRFIVVSWRQGENDIWAVMLLWQPELLFTVGLKDLKALLAA